MIFKPDCLIRENEDGTRKKREGFAHTATGYLIPCCMLDTNPDDPLYKDLMKEELKVSNNENIYDILLSDEWETFAKAVVKGANKGIEHAPISCQRICGKKLKKT